MALSVTHFTVCLALLIAARPLRAEFQPTVELQTLSHFVVYDDRLHQRPQNDERNCVWTSDHKFVSELLALADKPSGFEFAKGQILAVFFSDDYNQELIQMVQNKSTGEVFADYARVPVLKQLPAPEPGYKYSRMTIVTFSPVPIPERLEIRRMIDSGFSQRIK